MFVDFCVKGRAGHTEQLSRAGAIATGHPEGLADQHAGDSIHAAVEEILLITAVEDVAGPLPNRIIGVFGGGGGDRRLCVDGLCDVLFANWGAAIEDEGFLDRIGEFAYIASPRMKREDFQRSVRDPGIIDIQIRGKPTHKEI